MGTNNVEEKRIYAIVAGTVTVPANFYIHNDRPIVKFDGKFRTVVQPIGRQVAQVAHVVSKLRHSMLKLSTDETTLPVRELFSVANQRKEFIPITTIVLQVRDSAELTHIYSLASRKKLNPVFFQDENESAYGGPGPIYTAVAFLATPKENVSVADYLPLWGSNV